MKKKSWIAIGISLLVGILIQVYVGDFRKEPDIANKIAVLFGGGLGFLVWVIAVPLIISIGKYIYSKSFPNDLFSNFSYVILVILSVLMLLGLSSIKSMAQSPVERFRINAKQQCIELTANVYEQIETADKAEMQERAKNYCICLYDKISDDDLNSVIEKDLLLPGLLNLNYQDEQDICFDKNYSDINTVKFQELFETVSEKRNFWKSRLISYYLMTYEKFDSESFTSLNQCFEPSFIQEYSMMIPNWEERELTSTEIFEENPELKNSIAICYKDFTGQ